MKANTVDNAVAALDSRGIRQPTMFRVAGILYVKATRRTTPSFRSRTVSFTDAVELTFMCFHVFHAQYPFVQ